MKSRIVILNYKGKDLLPKCLPSVLQAAQAASEPAGVTVLDNSGLEEDAAYVKTNFPQVDYVRAPANLCLCSYNAYLRTIHEPVAILLNNDIRVEPDFIDPLVDPFSKDPQTFLVAPRVMTFDGRGVEAGPSRAGVRLGLFWCDARYPGYEKDLYTPSGTYSSGFGAFSREKFLQLGGYDEKYLPGIMEDVDLCWRAKQSGWHLLYEPRSVVYHMGQASFKSEFGTYGIRVLAARNSFLFMWKNFSGLSFWLWHLFFLPFRIIWATLKGNLSLAHGFFQALFRKGRP